MRAQILVPLDGSALAEGVLPQAQAVARATGRGLTLVRVLPAPIMVEPVPGRALPPDGEAARHAADLDCGAGYLQRVVARLPGPVQTVILTGDPATAIVSYAVQHSQVEVIAMATHGRTGVGRWMVGSVAESVLHTTPVPVLLSRPGTDLPPILPPPVYRTILVPLDGSSFAEQALDPAVALAGAARATLVLVSADEPLREQAVAEGVAPCWITQDRQNGVLHREEYLRATSARLVASGIPVMTQLVQGPPAVAILDASERVQADLIVMATHGRRGFQRLRLGSVALQVVQGAPRQQGAPRPVLLYRTQPGAELPAAPLHFGRQRTVWHDQHAFAEV